MRIDNPFDAKLDLLGHRVPDEVRETATYVTDTLEIAWAAARSVFEAQATPDHALRILELWLTRIRQVEGALDRTGR